MKNPSCDEVNVVDDWNSPRIDAYEYKIIIPKEEPKHETLEEAAEKNFINIGGVLVLEEATKWQQERSYSEEDLKVLMDYTGRWGSHSSYEYILNKWFEQYKKK